MGNEINTNNVGMRNLGSTRHEKVGNTANDKGNPVQTEADNKTERSGESASMTEYNRLNRISEELSRLPDIDHARVAKIKQAIADGSFDIDPEQIARSLIDFADSNSSDNV